MLIDLATGPQTFVLSREGYFKGTVILTVTEGMTGRAESRTVVLIPRGKPRAAAAVTPPARAGGRAGSAPPVAPAGGPPTATPNLDPFGLTPASPSNPTNAKSVAGSIAPESPNAAAPAAAPPSNAAAGGAPSVLPFGPEMTRPTLVSGSELVYPREAIVAGVAGTIIAKCTITVEGTVRNCRIIKGLPFLDKATLDTLATRRYSPVIYQGKPVSVEYVFNLKVAPPPPRQ